MNTFDGYADVTPGSVNDYSAPRYEMTPEERMANLEYTKAKTQKLKLEIQEHQITLKDTLASPDEAQVYPFFVEVDPVSVVRFIQTTSLWSRRRPGSEITLMLSSPGGDVVSGLAMHDHIIGLRNKGHIVTIKVLSMAASMAAIILQSGTTRVMGSSALMMVHEGGAQLVGSRSNIADSQKALEMMDKACQKAICGRSGISTAKYKSLIRRKDHWMDATEALKLNLCDAVED